MVVELFRGIYGALGELFYIPFISGRGLESEPRLISEERQRPRTKAAQLENYLGIHRLSPDSINGSLRGRDVNETFERLVGQYPELVDIVKSAAIEMATYPSKLIFSDPEKSEYIADQIILNLPKPSVPFRIPCPRVISHC